MTALEIAQCGLGRLTVDVAFEVNVEDVFEGCVRLGARLDLREVQAPLGENRDAPRESALLRGSSKKSVRSCKPRPPRGARAHRATITILV